MNRKEFKSLKSLKRGTKFKTYGKNDVELIATAGAKRGYYREIHFEGIEGTFQQNANDKVEVIKPA